MRTFVLILKSFLYVIGAMIFLNLALITLGFILG